MTLAELVVEYLMFPPSPRLHIIKFAFQTFRQDFEVLKPTDCANFESQKQLKETAKAIAEEIDAKTTE